MINVFFKSSSNGTLKTLENLKQAAELLKNGFDQIQEINNGTYNPALFGPIPFNESTCPELAVSLQEIQETLGRIRAYLKKQDATLQALVSRIAESSILNVEELLGHPVTADILENLEDHVLEALAQMPEEELERLEEKYAASPVEEDLE